MFKAVIFDLDGTILDTLRDLAEAGNHALAEHGLLPYPQEEYKRMVGNGVPRLIERMAQGQPADMQKAVMRSFQVYYTAHMADYTAPYPGILSMLSRLKEKGVRMAVLSNKADEFVGPIVGKYFPNMFEQVLGLKEGFPAKPDPASALYLAKLLDADTADTLYVGDSDVDMLTAKAANMPGCGVLWGFRGREELVGAGARFIAATPKELEDLVIQSC